MIRKSPLPAVMKYQVMRALYSLPLDIKKYIYRLVVKDHMVEWKTEHSHKLYQLFLRLKSIGRVRSDMIQTYFVTGLGSMRARRLCDPSRVQIGMYLIEDKTTNYEIRQDLAPFWEIDRREFTDQRFLYWAANKCRCRTCDLVRLAHRLDNMHSQALDKDVNKTYARITYESGDKQWKTMTVSQAKVKRDKERSRYRNRMKLAKKESLA